MATFVTYDKLSKIMDAIKTRLAKKLDASGIKNDASTTDSGYVLDARMGKTLGDRATTLETKVGDLYFDTDSSGNWGFKSSKNGAVKSFTATGAASTIESSNLAVSKALVSDANGKVAAAETTAAELGFLHGVTSAVQEQISSLNSNLASFQTGVDALYNQIVSLGVTPEGKTLAAIKNSISSVSDNSYSNGKTEGYNNGYSEGQTAGYNSGYSAGKSAATITSVQGVGSANQTISTTAGALYICTGLGNNVNGNIEWGVSGASTIWSTGGNSGGQQYRVNLVKATGSSMYVTCGNHVHSSVVKLVTG